MSSSGSEDLISRANKKVTTDVLLPKFSKDLGEDFVVTVRKLTGRNADLLQNIPANIGQTDLSVEEAIRQLPWLKRMVCAAVVRPKIVEKPIGEHAADELSVDAIENDLEPILTAVLQLSNLLPEDYNAGDAFRPKAEDAPSA